jgi:hypothetical protein
VSRTKGCIDSSLPGIFRPYFCLLLFHYFLEFRYKGVGQGDIPKYDPDVCDGEGCADVDEVLALNGWATAKRETDRRPTSYI